MGGRDGGGREVSSPSVEDRRASLDRSARHPPGPVPQVSPSRRPSFVGTDIVSSAIGSKPSPAVTITFDCPSSGFSGLRIAGLQVSGEAYSIYKGVRLTGKGKVEVRCV